MKPRLLYALLSCILLISYLPPALGQTASISNQVRAYREAHETEIIRELAGLLAIPNVASDKENIRRNAAMIVEMMKRRGIEANTLEGGEGPPAVYGEFRVPGATRTLGFYAHYDGQPVDVSKWASPPFVPTLRDGPIESGGRIIPFPTAERFDPESRIYARSASDDKAPIIAILTAIDALKASRIPITSNLKFFFEGEEEVGSPHLKQMLDTHGSLLGADVWFCADGPVHQTRQQSLYFGVRGIVTATITVYGANRGLHSGHYGNWAPNPAMRLAKLLATMKADSGKVLIDGFYDDVVPLGEDEIQALKEIPAVDRTLMDSLGLASTDGEGRSLAELINEPSLNVDGLRSEDVGPRARTIIPSEATATIDMRLVKGIEPGKQLERLIRHIEKQGYVVISDEPDRELRLKHPFLARVVSADGYRAIRTPINLPIVRQTINAVEGAIGTRPVLVPTLGGSVPLWIFEEATRAPQVGVPIVNHDNNQHSENENIRIQNLWDGIEVFAAIMSMI